MKQPDADDRYRIIALFTLAGAAFGVLFAMLCLTTGYGYGRTNINESVPLTMFTTFVGAVAGTNLADRPTAVRWAVTTGVLLLTGLLGAAMAWLVGEADGGRNAFLDSPGRATALGGLIGLLVGACILAPRWLKRA